MDYDGVNYTEMGPEYDMEFARYGPNPLDLPMSPPQSPRLEAGDAAFTRELSPFSEASSMTSVNSTDSVGTFHVSPICRSYTNICAPRLLSRRGRQDVSQPGELVQSAAVHI